MAPSGNAFALLNDIEDEATSIYERVTEEIKSKQEEFKKQKEEEMEKLKLEKKMEDKRLQNKLKRLRKKDKTMTMERLLDQERENKSNIEDRSRNNDSSAGRMLLATPMNHFIYHQNKSNDWFTARSLSQISGFSDLSELSSKGSSESLPGTGSSFSDLGFDGWLQQGRRSWRGRPQGFQAQWGSNEEQEMGKQSNHFAEQGIQRQPWEKQVLHAANAQVRGNGIWNRDSFHREKGRGYGSASNGSDSRSEREEGDTGRVRRVDREQSSDKSSDAGKNNGPEIFYKTLDQYEKELQRLVMSEDANNVANKPKQKAEDKPKKELKNSLGIVLVYKKIPRYRKPVMEAQDQTKTNKSEVHEQPQVEPKKPEPDFSLTSQDFPGLSH